MGNRNAVYVNRQNLSDKTHITEVKKNESGMKKQHGT